MSDTLRVEAIGDRTVEVKEVFPFPFVEDDLPSSSTF